MGVTVDANTRGTSPDDKVLAKKSATGTEDVSAHTIFNVEGFERDIRQARDSTKPTEGEEFEHLAKLELWTTILGLIGLPLMLRGVVSPTAMICLGYYRYAKFAILAHHNLHGGYGYRRRGWYAQGFYRRLIDWLDWILPEAWIVEHNKEHHYKLNEDTDPDYVQRNTDLVRMFPTKPLRYFLVFFNAAVWKWAYYASNTLKLLHKDRPGAPPKKRLDRPFTLIEIAVQFFQCQTWSNVKWFLVYLPDFIFRCMAPPLLLNFVAIPMVAFGLARLTGGDEWNAFTMAIVNFMGSELVNNVHSFATIATNHSGCDLWHFNEPCKADCAEFYLRAILGSSAYHAGTDAIDYFHGFLNYQGEHHAFPSLSPLHYQRLHPKFKAVCKKYGVPYVQEPVWMRVKRTADIAAGTTKHKEMPGQATDHPELFVVDSRVVGG